MTGAHRSSRWIRFFTILICIGLFGNLVVFLILSGFVNIPNFSTAPAPTGTPIRLEVLTLTPSTPTPFQPLPTETPTPTPTYTPTPTSTNTPRPTNTPLPPPTQEPTQPSDGLPAAASITGIYGFNQSHPLSCESRSAVDWARYFGTSLSEDEFQSNLPLSDDPDSGFVGSPDDAEGQLPPNSYGVHAEPVAALLRQYDLNASAIYGFSYDELRKEIAAGRPVIVWVYGNVWSGGYPVSYTASNGHTSTVVAFEHTVIVTGYDGTFVTLLDGGMAYVSIISQFKNSWATLGNMAVVMQ